MAYLLVKFAFFERKGLQRWIYKLAKVSLDRALLEIQSLQFRYSLIQLFATFLCSIPLSLARRGYISKEGNQGRHLSLLLLLLLLWDHTIAVWRSHKALFKSLGIINYNTLERYVVNLGSMWEHLIKCFLLIDRNRREALFRKIVRAWEEEEYRELRWSDLEGELKRGVLKGVCNNR